MAGYGFEELKKTLELWPYRAPPWSDRCPELVHTLDEDPMAPRGVVVSNNILVSCVGDEIEARARGHLTMKQNLMEAPASILTGRSNEIPRVDPAEARVRAVDFQAIPYARIGIEREGVGG